MKKFSINRVYFAFAVVIICLASCIARENPYINVLVISFAFGAYLMLMAYVLEHPTEGEQKVINKLTQIF